MPVRAERFNGTPEVRYIVSPETITELVNCKEYIRELERWEARGPVEPIELSGSDRQDARLVACAEHYDNRLKDNKRHMDMHDDEAKVQRQMLEYERRANLAKLRREPEATADFDEINAGTSRTNFKQTLHYISNNIHSELRGTPAEWPTIATTRNCWAHAQAAPATKSN